MTVWSPDTCDCKIEYDENGEWIKTIKKCRLHQRLKKQDLFIAVMAQNRRFNSSLGDVLNEKQEDKIALAKEINKLRIKAEDLRNFDEHLPHEVLVIKVALTFLQKLRKMLRL